MIKHLKLKKNIRSFIEVYSHPYLVRSPGLVLHQLDATSGRAEYSSHTSIAILSVKRPSISKQKSVKIHELDVLWIHEGGRGQKSV